MSRDFSGVLTEARYVGKRFDLYAYRLVLLHWPWLLTLRAQCRIFRQELVKQIINEALGDGKYGPIDDSIVTGSYPEPEYTVQYRETNLNFALRLMAKYGIYFYFKFDEGDGTSPSAHTLVHSDDTSFRPCPKSNRLYSRRTSARCAKSSVSAIGRRCRRWSPAISR
jgi:type VI secretion system secreted protein VgrG